MNTSLTALTDSIHLNVHECSFNCEFSLIYWLDATQTRSMFIWIKSNKSHLNSIIYSVLFSVLFVTHTYATIESYLLTCKSDTIDKLRCYCCQTRDNISLKPEQDCTVYTINIIDLLCFHIWCRIDYLLPTLGHTKCFYWVLDGVRSKDSYCNTQMSLVM